MADNIPETNLQAPDQSPVHNRTDEEKAAEVISDDITDEDKVEAEHREDVQKKVSAKIFSGDCRILFLFIIYIAVVKSLEKYF